MAGRSRGADRPGIVAGATVAIPDGRRIRVHGAAGYVEILG